MLFKEGHGILGRIQFKDGVIPHYDRTYLVICVTDGFIEVLNVSSIKGKERKLAFPTNHKLRLYNPPFLMPSFVKLDSLTKVEEKNCNDLQVLNNGRTLDSKELENIKIKLNLYES